MACTDINQFLESESNRIVDDPSEKQFISNPWQNDSIVPRSRWPNGMGDTPNFLTFERAMPYGSDVAFTTYGFNDGGSGDEGGSCQPPVSTIYPSQTRRSMELKIAAVESPPFCIEDARMSYNIVQQAAAFIRNLRGYSRYLWENQRRDQFTAICSNKYVADAGLTVNSASFATGTIGTLKREMLDYIRYSLIRNGADIQNGLSVNKMGQPLLPLVLSDEAQQTLATDGVTIQNIRWDSEKVRALNNAPGSFDSLNGFKMTIDIAAARWNLVGGAWVRVPFMLPATNKGDPANVNPAYFTAQYEDAIIATKQVVKFAIPDSQLSAGEMKFAPQDYLGRFNWINKYDRTCNVDENIGFFRGKFAYGAQPVIPEYGAILRFRRCPTNWVVNTACS